MLPCVKAVDSHTGGEPTRLVIEGVPDLGPGDLAARRRVFQRDFDCFRSAVCNEPRGHDVLVGALLVPPAAPDCVAGVIFFNNIGPLWMCGHGLIGVVATLGHLGRIAAGTHRIDTPVGVVTAEYDGKNGVAFENVVSRRTQANVPVPLPTLGITLHGDVAWGGNWFFLCGDHGLEISRANLPPLTEFAVALRTELQAAGIAGDDGNLIDHIELVGPPADPANSGRNFVLCPGLAYDRSPCGTGTSAKLACLAADGKLQPGEIWRQESVAGSLFRGSYRNVEGGIVPRIEGSAHVTAELDLLFHPDDPLKDGLR